MSKIVVIIQEIRARFSGKIDGLEFLASTLKQGTEKN
jgi:hypothetical protein